MLFSDRKTVRRREVIWLIFIVNIISVHSNTPAKLPCLEITKTSLLVLDFIYMKIMTSSQIWVDSFPLASDLFLPRFTERGLDPYLMGLHLSGASMGNNWVFCLFSIGAPLKRMVTSHRPCSYTLSLYSRHKESWLAFNHPLGQPIC